MAYPNVLLLVFDTARADAFEPYGATRGATETIAQLARRGVAVQHAYAPACWTVPSHGSLLLGRAPRSHQLGQRPNVSPPQIREDMVSRREDLFPHVLARNGFSTAGVSANLWVSQETGFDTGFEDFRYVGADRTPAMVGTTLRDQVKWSWESLRATVDDGAAEVERVLASWLAERDNRPFFWFVNLVECHSPYLPPRPYNNLGPVDRLRSGADARRHQTFAAFCRSCLGGFDVPADALQRMRHLYARAILLLDDWLARVLSALDEAKVLDDTVVLVTSDHGENIGEGGLMGHAFSLDERLIRVPFVVAGPWVPSADRLISLVHVPHMLASGIGIEDHPWHENLVPDEVAIAQLDAPCDPQDPVAAEAVAGLGLSRDAIPLLTRSLSCATDGRLKVFRDAGRETIVDLQEDPLEQSPVRVGRSHEQIHGFAIKRLRSALDAAEAAELPLRTESSRKPTLSKDLEDRMRLLGYL